MKYIKEANLSEALAKFVCSVRYADLPDDVIIAVKRAMMDTIGVSLGALAENESSVVLEYVKHMSPKQGGKSIVFGQGYRTLPELAAFANGTLAHLLDFDDSHNPMGGHPSAPLVPTILALAEQTEASGKDIILAFAIGFEIETKLSRIVNPLLYARGWHPTSVLSIFGTTAAAAYLLRLNETTTTYALATAASFCSGIKGNFGTLTKSLHVGKAAQHGLQAAYLAHFGNTSNKAIFEADMGFLDLFCSPNPDDWNFEAMGSLGKPWEIVDPGITVKPYPCCGSTHSTIDGHIELLKKGNIEPSNIAWIRNSIHERRVPHTNRPSINTGLEGKFSNQYLTALIWTKGHIAFEHFNDRVFKDPEILAMMNKVELKGDPEISRTAHETHALVEIGMKDGQTFSYKVTKRKGSPQNPLSDKELEDKFRYCAGRVHTKEWINTIVPLLNQLEQLSNINHLTDSLVQPATKL